MFAIEMVPNHTTGDANVLYPVRVADLVLSSADDGLLRFALRIKQADDESRYAAVSELTALSEELGLCA